MTARALLSSRARSAGREAGRNLNMDLLRWVAEGSNIFGLMVYSAGMILIAGALVLANYADNRQDEQKQSANR